MAEGILFGLAEDILKNLGATSLNEVASAWGFKDRLDQLKETINTIKNVLLDAEDRQADSHAIRNWLERLATAVYAADDLFDEVATVASWKELMGGNKVTKEVHTFFSGSNQIVFAFSIFRKIRNIRKKLDGIVNDSTLFNFVHRPREGWGVINTIKGRDQTISYANSEDVIGRDADKKVILDLLASNDNNINEVLHVISIVGIGGQGKTALAQLLYNDPWVQEHFELKLWVCVSENFDVKEITEKILKSATKTETPKLDMEQLQGLLRNELGDQKYFLVLDDVWNENREEWLELEALLKVGRKGSKIIVTTRSKEVANAMGDVTPYELQGLLEEKSWELFEKMAFMPGLYHENQHHMMEVGREIVKKCANVPLAIRAVGSLLYGTDEKQWLLLKDGSLSNILDSKDGVMDILKLSYQHLPSPLKNCFAYCALFPKDYQFNKETLIDLWMAEGFIIPLNGERQSLEELADDYFNFLLQRCFFQEITKDEWGDIISCKMHDLMHDLALKVAGVKCQVAKSDDSNINKGIHHLSFAYRLNSLWTIPTWMLDMKLLRTFLLPEQMNDGSPFNKLVCQELTSRFRSLRVLDLHGIGIKSLPNSIGKLIHLRYLNLFDTPIRELPDAITKLQNLQTLNLYHCVGLQTFPGNMRKLNNLRILDVGECYRIIYMPPGLGELTSLIKLPRFIVNKGKPNSAKLSDLGTLDNLRSVLHIEIVGKIRNPLVEATEANLNGKHGLTELHIEMDKRSYEDVSLSNHDEDVLEGLKPHSDLKKLEIYWYRGQKLPSWLMNSLHINLPKVVEIQLLRCGSCQQIPSFAKLPFLKDLSLVSLQSVEYMEVESDMDGLSLLLDSPSMKQPFFPSLEKLTLMDMDKLEGWWKLKPDVNDAANHASHQITEQRQPNKSLSRLSKLRIQGCPKLKFLPLCPNVEELTLLDVNETISVSRMATSSTSASTSSSNPGSKLKRLTISNVEDLISLPRECLHQLSHVDVQDGNLVSTDGIGINEVFKSLSSSLRTLQFTFCYNLRTLGQGLEPLRALEKLKLWVCEELDLSPNEELPWKYFKNLRDLGFHHMPKLASLPSGLQHLQNLHSLEITFCEELEELPEWISCFTSLGVLKFYHCSKLTSLPDGFRNLTSLNQLFIWKCPGLTERCRPPNGSDWPKIQHIPFVQVRHNL